MVKTFCLKIALFGNFLIKLLLIEKNEKTFNFI